MTTKWPLWAVDPNTKWPPEEVELQKTEHRIGVIFKNALGKNLGSKTNMMATATETTL